MLSARARSLSPYVLVGVLAFALRFALVLRTAGPLGSYGYDAGVYYASADALIHGRVPYRDFVLLHPPAVMLALTPSALLGHLTDDRIGFVSGDLLFTMIGSVNAVLTVLVARRWGLPRRAALLGGLFYAISFGAAQAEYLSRLEPLGNLFLLLALHQAAPKTSRRALRLSGAALALAVSTKIWFVVPLLVLCVWMVVRRGRTAILDMGLGIAVTALVVDGPFLVLSRGVMVSRVVFDQLGRHAVRDPLARLEQLTTAARLPEWAAGSAALAAMLVVASLGLILVARAASSPATRLFAVLAVAQVSVLLLSPSWFGFYSDFATVPLALCLAGTAASGLRVRGRLNTWTAATGGSLAMAALVITVVLAAGTFPATTSWQGADHLAGSVQRLRCVMSDMPSGLIELNRLDSDLSHGCRNWVDVTGRTYFGVDDAAVSRAKNRRWQADLSRYLRRGEAVFIVRASGDGLTRRAVTAIGRGGVLSRHGAVRVYWTSRCAAACIRH